MACTAVIKDNEGLCVIYGEESSIIAKKIANAMHLFDTVQKGTQVEIKNLITEIKKK